MSAVLAAEPTPGLRAYLCAFETADGARSWLVARRRGGAGARAAATSATPSRSRRSARSRRSPPSGGDLDELLSQLVALRLTENPEGIDEAEEAVRALQRTIGDAAPARLAGPPRRDRRRDETARAGARSGRSVAVHGGAQGRPGDDRRAAAGGRGDLPRAARLVTSATRLLRPAPVRWPDGRRRLLSVRR